ncbi:MAG: hypothetical protein COA74_09655 [Gammaproteobacteria bacterium]|nr:MAG: hypothetical protein COA74_09655 [Gammaproteobacteria bacterium]
MICYIYRSIKKTEMYLYTLTRDDFSNIPEGLIKAFGTPEFSMVINLTKRDKLARVDIALVKQHLEKDGFYLQMPPTILNDQNFLTPEDD